MITEEDKKEILEYYKEEFIRVYKDDRYLILANFSDDIDISYDPYPILERALYRLEIDQTNRFNISLPKL